MATAYVAIEVVGHVTDDGYLELGGSLVIEREGVFLSLRASQGVTRLGDIRLVVRQRIGLSIVAGVAGNLKLAVVAIHTRFGSKGQLDSIEVVVSTLTGIGHVQREGGEHFLYSLAGQISTGFGRIVATGNTAGHMVRYLEGSTRQHILLHGEGEYPCGHIIFGTHITYIGIAEIQHIDRSFTQNLGYITTVNLIDGVVV